MECQYTLLGCKEAHPYHLLSYQALGRSIISHSDGITYLRLLICTSVIHYIHAAHEIEQTQNLPLQC